MDSGSSNPNLPRTLVIMGVSGSGKTLIGQKVAARLDGVFEDADDFHSEANKAKMASGTPLTDEDRWPWYAALRRRIVEMRKESRVYVLACSALKEIYRQKLAESDASSDIVFILLNGPREVIQERLNARKGHYMPPSLLGSQIAILEPTPDLLEVSLAQTPEEIVEQILSRISA